MRQKISNDQISRTIKSLNKLINTDLRSLAADVGCSVYYMKSTIDLFVRLELIYRYGNRIIVPEIIPDLTLEKLQQLTPNINYHRDRLEAVRGTKDAEIIRSIHIMGHLYLIQSDKNTITIDECVKLTNAAKSSAKLMLDLLVRSEYMKKGGMESYTFIKEIPVVSRLFNFVQDLRTQYPYRMLAKTVELDEEIVKPKVKEEKVEIKHTPNLDWIDSYANSFESITTQREHLLLLNTLKSAAVCI